MIIFAMLACSFYPAQYGAIAGLHCQIDNHGQTYSSLQECRQALEAAWGQPVDKDGRIVTVNKGDVKYWCQCASKRVDPWMVQ